MALPDGCDFVPRGWYDGAAEHFNIAYQMEPGNAEYEQAMRTMTQATVCIWILGTTKEATAQGRCGAFARRARASVAWRAECAAGRRCAVTSKRVNYGNSKGLRKKDEQGEPCGHVCGVYAAGIIFGGYASHPAHHDVFYFLAVCYGDHGGAHARGGGHFIYLRCVLGFLILPVKTGVLPYLFFLGIMGFLNIL